MNSSLPKITLSKNKSAVSLEKISPDFISYLANLNKRKSMSSSQNNIHNDNEETFPFHKRTFDRKTKTCIKPNIRLLNKTNTSFKNNNKNKHRFSCILNNIANKQKIFYGSTYQEVLDKKKEFVRQAERKIKDKDKLFKLFRESGLHYSLSSHKYFFGDKEEKFKKTNNIIYSMKRMLGDKDDNSNNINQKNISGKKLNLLKGNKDSKQRLQKNKSLPSIFYSTTEEDDEDKMKFNDYLQLQSKADVRLRPKLGETSYDLVNYIKKIEGIRKNIMVDFMKEIKKMENRYNEEHPKSDAHVKTKLQGLYNHRWKNLFYLDDYQNLFLENLRGKISTKNYNIMSKYFKQIQMMCFSDGPIKFSKIKSVKG